MSQNDERQLLHTRTITCRAFRRRDGLLDIEATVTDLKGQEVPFRSRPPVNPGELMHNMALTLTVDDDFLVHDVAARTLQGPWPVCGGVDAAYRSLIGCRIGDGFSRQVKERLGGIKGCTHITELVTQAANTYMQASWPGRIARQLSAEPDPSRWPEGATPKFINQCHAWRQDGEALASEYPELVPPKAGPSP